MNQISNKALIGTIYCLLLVLLSVPTQAQPATAPSSSKPEAKQKKPPANPTDNSKNNTRSQTSGSNAGNAGKPGTNPPQANDGAAPPGNAGLQTGTQKLDPVQAGTSDPDLPAEKAHPLLLRAEDHFFNKRYHVALRLLKKVLEEDPENARAYLYTGDIYLIQQNYGLAEEQFQIAMELAKNPAREWFRLGQVRLLRKNAKGALEAFDKSLAAGPGLHINYFYKGLVYYNLLQNKDETIKNWQEYRKRAPDAAQGPQIDKAIAILMQPDFKFPEKTDDPCIQLPTGKETKVPYKPAEDAKEKTNDTGAEPIDIDDL